MFPLSATLDHVGPLTRSVEDAAAMLEAIAGYDSNDPTSAPGEAPNYLAAVNRGVKGLRIGIDRKYAFDGVDLEIKLEIDREVRCLNNAGSTIVPFKMPAFDAALADWVVLCSVVASLAHTESYPSKKRG